MHQMVIRKREEAARIRLARTRHNEPQASAPSTTKIMPVAVGRAAKNGTPTASRSRIQMRTLASSRWKPRAVLSSSTPFRRVPPRSAKTICFQAGPRLVMCVPSVASLRCDDDSPSCHFPRAVRAGRKVQEAGRLGPCGSAPSCVSLGPFRCRRASPKLTHRAWAISLASSLAPSARSSALSRMGLWQSGVTWRQPLPSTAPHAAAAPG